MVTGEFTGNGMAFRIDSGILFFFKPGRDKKAKWARRHAMEHRQKWMEMHQGRPGMNFGNEQQQQSDSVDGFLHSENVWGAARHVVLDELFKGAEVRTSFGGTTIDLRHTHIASGETYIDVDCNWAESRYMPLPTGKSYLNVTPSLAGVMTSAGQTGMLTRIVY